MIFLKGVTKKYFSQKRKEEVLALNKVDLTLPNKGFVVVYGASGCGKSTLLNMIGGLDFPDSGEIIVENKNTKHFSKQDWNSFRNQDVGFIFQNYYLLPHLNVFDNIAITLQMSRQNKGIKEKISEALKAVGLKGFEKRFPKQLSGGQQQRVAIARALISNPTIILADEPTGALDKKSSDIVMQILKDISKTHLVVMVTHNERMAKLYADRMIEISFGKIVSDVIYNKSDIEAKPRAPFKRIHLPFLSTVKWSARNVVLRKERSIPIALATAISLACVGLVLSMTRNVKTYINDCQTRAMRSYPITVYSYSKTSSEGNKQNLVQFPDNSDVIIEKGNVVVQEHYNNFDDDFARYASHLPTSDYALSYSNISTAFNLITKPTETSYISVNTRAYTMCIASNDDAYSFIKNQYDVLQGHLPENENELALVVDTYNRIDINHLKNMGFEVDSRDVIKAEEILSKEYRVVSNDDKYHKSSVNLNDKTYNTYIENTNLQELYNNKSYKTLKISGIIRSKKDLDNQLYNTILLYHPDLLNKLSGSNASSKIVCDQLSYGLDFDVLTGAPFVQTGSNPNYTAEYNYEQRLIQIGAKTSVNAVFYYTETFEQRDNIMNYFNAYSFPEDSHIVLKVADSLSEVSDIFRGLVNTLSSVLILFSLIAILVSGILTGILTYISVIERKREIGLLRSLGARKIDISSMFILEALVTGAVSGIVGIALCYLFTPLVAKIVVILLEFSYSSIFSVPPSSYFAHVNFSVIPIVVIGAIALEIIASLIPAIIAGNKKPADCLKE